MICDAQEGFRSYSHTWVLQKHRAGKGNARRTWQSWDKEGSYPPRMRQKGIVKLRVLVKFRVLQAAGLSLLVLEPA